MLPHLQIQRHPGFHTHFCVSGSRSQPHITSWKPKSEISFQEPLEGVMQWLLATDWFSSILETCATPPQLILKLLFSLSVSEFLSAPLIYVPFLSSAGLHEIQCSLPVENRRIFLNELSEVSFSECKFSLSLTDLFIIIFSGVAVSIAAILSSFFLATLVHCFQRCAPSKDDDDDEDDSEDWT